MHGAPKYGWHKHTLLGIDVGVLPIKVLLQQVQQFHFEPNPSLSLQCTIHPCITLACTGSAFTGIFK
jgi:hypothetical protein